MLFDSSVRKELARSFGATLVVILTIVVTMMLIRTLGLAANGAVSPQDVVLVLGYNALGQLPLMLGLSLFVSVVITLGRMYRDSEMAIWFSAGIGLARFIGPVLRSGWPTLAAIAVLVLGVWPWGNRQMGELKIRYEQRSDLSRVAPGSFQSSADGSRVFFIERAGGEQGAGRNVFLLSRKDEVEAVTTARAGRVDNSAEDRQLVLDAGHRNEQNLSTGERTRMSFDELRTVVDPGRASTATSASPKTKDTLELLADPTLVNQGELAWRLGLLIGAANLLLLGIGTSVTNPRRPNNWNLLFALLAFMVYFNLVNLSQAWIAAGRVHSVVAMIVLHGSALLVALMLIWWRDHAAVRRWPFARMPKPSPSTDSAALPAQSP
ncbi:LPS export ABC transporter permease LptF [Ideonella sp.]|uniref:LPS export ABC transporter permease LptF n=1 Tax=Ideonella sp. TaxID=1929293 RepID=UPI003BB6C6DF